MLANELQPGASKDDVVRFLLVHRADYSDESDEEPATIHAKFRGRSGLIVHQSIQVEFRLRPNGELEGYTVRKWLTGP
jgi:hypothetical protein